MFTKSQRLLLYLIELKAGL